MYASLSCQAVYNAALADGLKPLPAAGQCESKRDKVALVVDPGADYHWYRQDGNGMWTHKPGRTPATNLDNSNVPIANPETADRCGGGPCCTDFCGYMCSCSSKPKVRDTRTSTEAPRISAAEYGNGLPHRIGQLDARDGFDAGRAVRRRRRSA
jgi:hypothetical protein